MKLSFFDRHPSFSKKNDVTTVDASTTEVTPAPSLADSLEEQDDYDDCSIFDDETVAMSNVSSHHQDEDDSTAFSSSSSKLRMSTLLSFPSTWGSNFFCGSLQVVYFVDN